MINLQDIVSVAMVCAGAFFMLIGGIGIIRLPDFFSRTHAISKSDTLGIMLVLGGLAVHLGFTLTSVKLIIACFFWRWRIPPLHMPSPSQQSRPD